MNAIASPQAMRAKHFDLTSHWLSIVGSAAILVAAWAMVALLVWNLDRGIDLTDEASLLNHYRHPDAYRDHYQHFRFVRALVPSALDHAYFYRLFKLIALVALTGAFSLLLAAWLDRRIGFVARFSLHRVVLFHFLLAGSLLAYCHGSQTLSYNDVVTCCLLIAAAACFALDLGPSVFNAFAWKFMVSALVGAIIALLVPVKWPCAPLLAGYFIVFTTCVSTGRGGHDLAASFGGAVFGAALLVLATSDVGFGTIFSYHDLFRALLNPLNLELHEPTGLMKRYAVTAVGRAQELLRSPAVVAALALPFAAMVVNAISDDRLGWRVLRGGMVLAALAFVVVFLGEAPDWAWRHVHYFHRYNIADLQTFAFVFAWIAACCCLLARKRAVPRREAIILMGTAALLASLPAIGSIGTANPLLTQFIRHMGPLFAALAITVAFLGFAGRWRPFAPVICAAIASLSAAQLAFVVLYYPYRLAAPGISQTIELAEPRHMAGLKVDARTAAFVDTLLAKARQAAGDTAGMPMLALFDIPGVVYILDGISVGYSWHTVANSESVTCRRIQGDPLSRARVPLIALDRDELSPTLVACMRKAGMDLAKYLERARIELPDDTTNGRFVRLLTPDKDKY